MQRARLSQGCYGRIAISARSFRRCAKRGRNNPPTLISSVKRRANAERGEAGVSPAGVSAPVLQRNGAERSAADALTEQARVERLYRGY